MKTHNTPSRISTDVAVRTGLGFGFDFGATFEGTPSAAASLSSTANSSRGAFHQRLRVFDYRLARVVDLRDQFGILPDRHAVLAPIEAEGPARQAFARIPFALPVM